MATFSYGDIEKLHTDHDKVFKIITTYLRNTHSVAFQGARKQGERQYDRYVTAFNKHSKDIRNTFGKALDNALGGPKKSKKSDGNGKVKLICCLKRLLLCNSLPMSRHVFRGGLSPEAGLQHR